MEMRQRRRQLLLLVVLSFFCRPISTQSAAQDAPKISKEINFFGANSNLVISSGNVPSLQIDAYGAGPLQYTWTKDDQVVKNSTEAFFRIVEGANVSDSGIYRCIVTNKYGAVRSLPFSLIVRELGTFPNVSDQTVRVQEGKFVVLNMPDISYLNDRFDVEWQQGGSVVPVNNYRYHVSFDHDLAVVDVPLNFNETRFRVKFTHTALANYKETYSNYFILRVTESPDQETFVAPEFVIRPKDFSAKVQTNQVKLECVINGQPFNNLQITWSKVIGTNKVEIKQIPGKYSLSTDDRILTIFSIAEDDEGVYECEGSLNGQTALSSITSRAKLSVLVPPSFSAADEIITKDFQESLFLACDAQGSPQPQTSWYFNGKELASLKDNRYLLFPNGSMAIQSVDLPDSGVYQCFASNSAGEAATSTQLVVNSAEPTMLQAPQDKMVAEHEDTAFTCKVKGGPQPEVYWQKDGFNLTIGGRIRLTRDQLLIGRVEMSDSGRYACHAVNIKGSISAEATLTVIVKTQIIKPPQNMSRTVGTDVMLDCGVRHDPSVTPNWTWYFYPAPGFIKEDIALDTGSKQLLTNGSLVIIGLIGKNTGKYECVVDSPGGRDKRTATLNVIDLPAQPTITQVMLYDKAPNSVLISWTLSYDGDTPVIKFVIENRKESFSGSNIDSPWETVNSNVDPSLRSLVVGNLLPSKYYRFRIIAVNKVGVGPASEAAPENEAIRMPVQPPGSPPLNLFCEQGKVRQIRVMWDPPPESTWNGDLQGYLIFYKVAAFGDDTEKVENVTGRDVRQTVINNLVYYKKYRVRIAAYNEKGSGVNSSDFFVTTLQGTPDAPPQNVSLSSPNSTTVRVEWNPPPPRLLNGVNQGYEIEVKQEGILKRLVVVRFDDDNPTGRQTFDIVNLTKFAMYEIQIACRTAQGAGPQSPSKSIRTLEDVPGPVTDLKIDNIRDKSLRINWKPPLEVNGILTGYRITYHMKDSTAAMTPIDRSPSTMSHTLTDLLYETTYIISVQAKTQVGPGPASTTEIVSGVPPELPEPPTSLAVTNIEARTVLLQFIPGFDGKTSITLWIVEAQVEGSTSWGQVYNISDPSASQIIVRNLRPFTKYRLRIKAQNIVDVSSPSEPCNPFETKQAAPGIPPQDVTPRAHSSTSIRVRWMQIPRSEWNGDSLTYQILYRRWSKDVDVNTTSQADLDLVREATWSTVELRNGSNIQEYYLTNLEEWMDYQIQMMSKNAVGSSSPSPVLSEKTEEDVPSASPVNVQPFAKSSTSVLVSWSPVPILQQNGNIGGYKVKYQARRLGAEPQFQTVEGASVLNVTLMGLRKYTEYGIQLLAFSRKGDGLPSSPVTVRTAGDVPGPPIILYFPDVNKTSATIMWQPPEEPNGIIIRYRVSYRRKDEPSTVMDANAQELLPSVNRYTPDTELDGETYYIFSVRARTQDGWGEAATVEVYTIGNRDRPDPPFNLRIDRSEIFARNVTIVWTPGNDNFGPVRNYTIQYKKQSEDWKTVEGTIKPQPGLQSYTVQNLRPNSRYTFRLAAYNDVGRSEFSQESTEVTTLEDKPDGAPQNVRIVAVTRTSINITWGPPPTDLWNSPSLLGYYVRYKRETDEGGAWQYQYEDGLNLVVNNLKSGQKYTGNVLAYNDRGGGPWSQGAFTYLEIVETWNGNLVSDIVQYREEGQETFREKTAPSGQLYATLQSLVIGVRYEIQVLAANVIDRGPPSILQVFLVGDVAPFKTPRDVRVINKSSTELEISWQPPPESSTNGKLIGYNVLYWHSASATCVETYPVQLSVTELRIVLDKLQPYTYYCITVQAVNIAGEGPKSTPIAIRTSEDVPGAPENVRFRNITLRELTILWDPPRVPNGRISEYKLEYFVSVNNEKTDVSTRMLPGGAREQYVTGLIENQRYTFSLAAINSIGIGSATTVSVVTGPQIGSPDAPLQPEIVRKSKFLILTWTNQGSGHSPIQGYQIHYQQPGISDVWTPILDVSSPEPTAQISLTALFPKTEYLFSVRAINSQGISPPSPPSKLYETPNSLITKKSSPFYDQWWFLIIVALSGVIIILLIISLLCYFGRCRNKDKELKRSATSTTVMSTTPEPEDGGFPSMELRQSRRSVGRNGRVQNSIYSRSPPRPSPASVTYSEGLSLPIAGASGGGAPAPPPIKPPLSDDTSSVLSEKPSNLGDSTDDDVSSDESSTDSIAKAPVPASPPPPAFSRHLNRNGVNNSSRGAGPSSSSNHNKNQDPSWRFNQNPHNAYTYTDSEAESSHYAFSLSNGNLVVNNVAGARTPLSGFSSFV